MGKYITESSKIVGCLAPVSIGSSAAVGKPIDFKMYDRVTFYVYVGSIGGSTGLVTVQKGTTSSLGTAIGYNYQFSSTGTAAFSVLDSATVTTAATATGLAMGTSPVQYGILAIELKASDLGAGYNWAGVFIAGSGTVVCCIWAECYAARQMAAVPADPTS